MGKFHFLICPLYQHQVVTYTYPSQRGAAWDVSRGYRPLTGELTLTGRRVGHEILFCSSN
jgi:hypothetical protein